MISTKVNYSEYFQLSTLTQKLILKIVNTILEKKKFVGLKNIF